MTREPVEMRRAVPADADEIAEAHIDSIRSLGARFYPPAAVDDWAEGLTGHRYRKALDAGEVFFIAVGAVDGRPAVLGFSSDYSRTPPHQHGSSVYVRGSASRQGIGSSLLKLAETEAVSQGATSILIEASLAGVDFYKRNGFVELARGETTLTSGRPIACVFMEKILSEAPSHQGSL